MKRIQAMLDIQEKEFEKVFDHGVGGVLLDEGDTRMTFLPPFVCQAIDL